MTLLQYQFIDWLRRRGYDPVVVRRENNGVWRIAVKRKLRQGWLFLLAAGDGTYRDAEQQTRIAQVRRVA